MQNSSNSSAKNSKDSRRQILSPDSLYLELTINSENFFFEILKRSKANFFSIKRKSDHLKLYKTLEKFLKEGFTSKHSKLRTNKKFNEEIPTLIPDSLNPRFLSSETTNEDLLSGNISFQRQAETPETITTDLSKNQLSLAQKNLDSPFLASVNTVSQGKVNFFDFFDFQYLKENPLAQDDI
jgi:hypothetical protein